MNDLNIYTAQMNPTIGDVVGNTAKASTTYDAAARQNVDLVVFTEGFLSGYPAEDLINKPDFLDEVSDGIDVIVAKTKNGPAALFGAPIEENGQVFNCAIYAAGGKILQVIKKQELPNYGVFDDKRNFAQGEGSKPIMLKGVPIGILVCEDTWHSKVANDLAMQGAKLLLSINASPYEVDKATGARMDVVQQRVIETGLPIIYVNQVGAQDGIVFDGHSFALNADHSLAWSAPGWTEHGAIIKCAAVDRKIQLSGDKVEWTSDLEELYTALVLGTRDYIQKNGFTSVQIGLSGGADSALVAAIASDAIGPENVHCVRLPSEYTSDDSNNDAEILARNLGCHIGAIPIKGMVNAASTELLQHFGEPLGDLTEQNLQARVRGMTLMAITNQIKGRMLLTTGNKSEMSVGYATLYGDMSGGFNPIKDVWKTQVFALMKWRNDNKPNLGLGPAGPIIPEAIITKPPTAELKPGQTDERELGNYDQLDDVLRHIIEKETPLRQIIAAGHAADYVLKIDGLVGTAEYKRRQSAPGVKVSRRALQGDRRYPITNGFRSGHRVRGDFQTRLNARLDAAAAA